MKKSKLILGASFSLSLFAAAPDARACGGCVVPPLQSTQVTGHRMILAASKTQTTLYDQIEYAGSPESFAWFLPIKGEVDVGLSADAMFAYLGDESQVVVYPPELPCVNRYDDSVATADAAGEPSDDGGGVYVAPEDPVNVIAQEVVGPYETVQIESEKPGALTQWLVDHGYDVPEDVQPIIDDYQSEGFGFLAMKLVPGEGVNSMRPVRVTTPGGGLGLPLRMVAAGTGAITPVTLYVVSEGRYEVDNRPNLRINEYLVAWDWDNDISNYREIRDGMADGSDGLGWVTESAIRFNTSRLVNQVSMTIEINPGTTDWGDPEAGVSEADAAKEDLDVLFSGMLESEIWLTRMYARLSRPALAEDLMLRAAAEQEEIPTTLVAKLSMGNPPDCSRGEHAVFTCSHPASPRRDGVAGLLAGVALLGALSFVRRRR
jgi:hypothetical protein